MEQVVEDGQVEVVAVVGEGSAFSFWLRSRQPPGDPAEEAMMGTNRPTVSADMGPAILWMTDPDGACTYLSRQWYEFTGQEPGEGLGFGWTEVVHPDDRERSADTFMEANARRTPFRLDYRLRSSGGGYRWAVDAGQPRFSESGEFLGYVGSVLDITERKEAEEALRASEERLLHVTASSPAVLYTLSVNGESVRPGWVSGNIEHIFGYTQEQALADDWWDRNLHPDDRDAAAAVLADFFRTGFLSHQYRFRHADGTYRWVRDQLRMVPAPEEGAVEGVGSWMDATEFRQLENQFHQIQKLEAVGRLAGGIAHDFNNVLTAITGLARLMLEDLDADGSMARDAREIVTLGEHGAGLVRQLLAFSRQQVIQPEAIELNTILTGMDRMLRRLIGADVRLRFALDPDAGWVRADRGQLEQVVLNLALNARDAMPDGGRLTISTTTKEIDPEQARVHEGASGRHVMLCVADTGTGMAEELLEKVFEPFFSTKESDKGTGLGLSIVYGIVKQSGGHIQLESEPGRGSTFMILLPGVEPVETAPRQASRVVPRSQSECVLLVEDQASVRAFARRVLERKGYRVMEASGGAEALRLCESDDLQIDLLLTDVIMPRMSGRELADRFRALRPGTPVLFMSGYPEEEISDGGVLADGTHFIEKPFSPAALARKAREILDAGPAAS